MQKPSDERLIAYLDGELDESERAEIALWLERDVALRERAARLTESAALLRSAFDDVLHEPLPERLVEAAHGAATGGAVVDLAAVRSQRVGRRLGGPRWWMGMASAASLFALLVGIGAGYIAGSEPTKIATGGSGVENASDTSPDNLAGYYKRYVNVSPDEAV
jgi:anti-sigma factor RsiW